MTLAEAFQVIAVLTFWFLAHPLNPLPPQGPIQPPLRGAGVAVGYGLGGAGELDALGPVWYVDYDYDSLALGKHRRLHLVNTRDSLAPAIRTALIQRGEWWQFGNEPNDPNQDNVAPAEYAIRFHAFSTLMRQIDPGAKILPAGIADADWKWAEAFRKEYRDRYGADPVVDGWSIHNFMLERCESALDVKGFQGRIVAFRDWMRRTGQSTPLWLTEYGVLYGNGCCGCPAIPADRTIAYLRATTQWLIDTRPVVGWAWFAVRTGGRYNGDLFDEAARLTPAGEAYRMLVPGSAGNERMGKEK